MRYKYRHAFEGNAARQGYIYFASQRYNEVSSAQREYIDSLCRKIGGEDMSGALRTAVTRPNSMQKDSLDYNLGISTLWRLCKRYYAEFDIREYERRA